MELNELPNAGKQTNYYNSKLIEQLADNISKIVKLTESRRQHWLVGLFDQSIFNFSMNSSIKTECLQFLISE